ncbi:uncharacterized protein [Gossypium hirsutum]|uniref:Uncharacterized protein isoform X2 n=1 Tax=Gossypium hirsutum TaxID=3635 RepID=A0ABM3BTM5_GOSHI|nr:uncharacterized protein LOC121229688 isoform X2 [Gossypium hirsutum]
MILDRGGISISFTFGCLGPKQNFWLFTRVLKRRSSVLDNDIGSVDQHDIGFKAHDIGLRRDIHKLHFWISCCATTAPGTTNYLSDKTDKQSNLNGIFCRTPEAAMTFSVATSISAGSKFKFGASADGSTFNNGSCASSPFSFSSLEPSLVPSNCQSSSSATATKNDSSAATITSASATANASNSFTSSLSVEASIPSFTGEPVFKFSSSGDPSTSVSTLSATSGEATESKTQDTKTWQCGYLSFW